MAINEGIALHFHVTIQVLDIGGAAVNPSFGSDPEVLARGTFLPRQAPPIPCHVHAGQVVDGKCQGMFQQLY
jgi:hypothetical protein